MFLSSLGWEEFSVVGMWGIYMVREEVVDGLGYRKVDLRLNVYSLKGYVKLIYFIL